MGISNLASDLVYLLRIERNRVQIGLQSRFSDIFYQNFIFSRKSIWHGNFFDSSIFSSDPVDPVVPELKGPNTENFYFVL